MEELERAYWAYLPLPRKIHDPHSLATADDVVHLRIAVQADAQVPMTGRVD